MNPYSIILRPVQSEKAFKDIKLVGRKHKLKYAFYIHPKINRSEAKKAIEVAFNVKVVKANIANVKGKIRKFGRYDGKTAKRKKIVVTLKAGQRISQLDGLIETEMD